MSWIESSCKMSLLTTFSKFLNVSEHCFYKVRKKNSSSHRVVSKAKNGLCFFNVSPKALSPVPSTSHDFLSWDPSQCWGGHGIGEHSATCGQEVQLLIDSSYHGPMRSPSYVLSQCLLVSQHRKLRIGHAEPASKQESTWLASIGLEGVVGWGLVKSWVTFTPKESLSPFS